MLQPTTDPTDVEAPPPGGASEADTAGRPLDAPIWAAGIAGIAALAFLIGRLDVAAHGNLGWFIVLGTEHVRAAGLPVRYPQVRGPGYDGQFYYRMALDPADLHRTTFGIRMDTVSRFERIGYPAIAWLLAAGRASLVPGTLVLTNFLALVALAFGGALLARDSGRHALWGLVLAAYSGYLWSAARDLTEITAAAFLVFGLYAFRKGRWWWAGLLLLASVLSKEPAMYVVLVLGATSVIGRLRRERRITWSDSDVAWGLPLIGFVAWQAVVTVGTGSVPVLASGNANIGLPLVGLTDGFRQYLAQFPARVSLIWFGELALLVLLTVMAALSVRHSSAPLHERWAWAAVVLLALCRGPGDLGGRRRLPQPRRRVRVLLDRPLRYPAAALAAGRRGGRVVGARGPPSHRGHLIVAI